MTAQRGPGEMRETATKLLTSERNQANLTLLSPPAARSKLCLFPPVSGIAPTAPNVPSSGSPCGVEPSTGLKLVAAASPNADPTSAGATFSSG